jgi:hypothetical protein
VTWTRIIGLKVVVLQSMEVEDFNLRLNQSYE